MKISNNNGATFFDLLALLFIALKLLGKISWSWIWVLSPLWGSLLLNLLIIVITKKHYS